MLWLLNLHLYVVMILFLFGLPDIAPLISTCIGQSPHLLRCLFLHPQPLTLLLSPMKTDGHCAIVPIAFFQDITAPGKVLQVSTCITIHLLQQHFPNCIGRIICYIHLYNAGRATLMDLITRYTDFRPLPSLLLWRLYTG